MTLHTCTAKLAPNTFQYSSTALCCKACTRHFLALLCTTKLAQSTSQYHFVLQSLHKALPSKTLYYKACTRHFPVRLRTTKLAQSNSQYYFVLQSFQKRLPKKRFVLQSLHKVPPSITLYCNACTKYTPLLPVLLCATKLMLLSATLYYKA